MLECFAKWHSQFHTMSKKMLLEVDSAALTMLIKKWNILLLDTRSGVFSAKMSFRAGSLDTT